MILRPRRPDEKFNFWYDNTKLVAANTCPTWAMVRYGHSRVPHVSTGRAMPLEAGQAMHKVFACVRLIDMIEHGRKHYGSRYDREKLDRFGASLFGEIQWDDASRMLAREGDLHVRAVSCALSILESSGFVDDPSDRRRTLSNMEEATLLYLRRWEWARFMPIWHGDSIGIELPFDLVFVDDDDRTRNFVGRIDALVDDLKHDERIVNENKTASRLDRSWQASFEMSHQVTGYMLAAEALFGERCEQTIVFGSALPVPREFDYGGLIRVSVTRNDTQRREWFEWFDYSARVYEQWLDRPEAAPKFTHSCSRYFRPCSLIQFCQLPREERRETLDGWPIEEWHPLQEKAS